MLSKSLIQPSGDGQGYGPSLLFDLRPNYGGGNEDNGDLLQKVPCIHCRTQCPDAEAGHLQPTPLPETPGHSQISLDQSLAGSLLLSPGSWCTQAFVCAFQETDPDLCLSLLWREESAVACRRGRGLGAATWSHSLWQKPSWRRLPLTPP